VSEAAGQSESEASGVPARATQDAETQGRDWSWVEASVWSERMLAALGNGVKGGKWFSLIDKVYRKQTLNAAWNKLPISIPRYAAGFTTSSMRNLGYIS